MNRVFSFKNGDYELALNVDALRRAEIRYNAYQKLYELFQERKGN